MLEMLHNEAPDKVIHWFDDFGTDNEYRFLSNFYVGDVPISISGKTYPSGEHAFQAFKARDEDWHERIRKASNPGIAKKLGRKCNLRPGWEAIKYDVMTMVIRHKFPRDSDLAARLLDTGDAMLVEGNTWHDKVWGVDVTRPGWPGRNWLGVLLMARRAELRAPVLQQWGNRRDTDYDGSVNKAHSTFITHHLTRRT